MSIVLKADYADIKGIITSVRLKEQKVVTHLLEVHLLPVDAFEKLMLLHLWGSTCVTERWTQMRRRKVCFS